MNDEMPPDRRAAESFRGPDDEAEADPVSAGQKPSNLKAAWMEMMFVLTIDHSLPVALEAILIVVEDIQIASLAFPQPTDEYASAFPLPLWIKTVCNPLAFTPYPDYASYYSGWTRSFAVVMTWFCVSAFIIFNTYRGKYYTVPMYLFSFLSHSVPRQLFLPITEALLSAVNCAYSSDGRLKAVTEENVSCFSTGLGPFLATAFTLVLYIPLAVFLSLCMVNPNPTSKSPTSKIHSRVYVVYTVSKALALLIKGFLPAAGVGIIVTLVMCAVVVLLLDYFTPHFSMHINFVRCGVFSCIFVFAALLGIFYSARVQNTVAVLGTIIPILLITFPTAYKISRWRYERRTSKIPARLEELAKLQSWEKDNYLVFDNPPSVELACRFITKEMNARQRGWDESKADLVYAMFERGVKEFPENDCVHLAYHLYSSFMRSARGGWVYPIQRAKALSPPLDTAFFIHMIETLAAKQQQMRELGKESAKLDVFQIAEYKKLRQTASMNHEFASRELRGFWRMLGKRQIDKAAVSRTIVNLHEAMDIAEKAYKQLLQKYPESAAINRFYASFLLKLKNEKEAAELHNQEADRLEERAATAHRTEHGIFRSQGNLSCSGSLELNDSQNDNNSVNSDGQLHHQNQSNAADGSQEPDQPAGNQQNTEPEAASVEIRESAEIRSSAETGRGTENTRSDQIGKGVEIGKSAAIGKSDAVGRTAVIWKSAEIERGVDIKRSADVTKSVEYKKSGTSGSSIRSGGSGASSIMMKRVAITNTMGGPANNMIKSLNIESNIVAISTIGLATIALVNILQILLSELGAQKYRRNLRFCSYFLARVYQSVRLMILAAADGDEDEFLYQKKSLTIFTAKLRSATRASYVSRPTGLKQIDVLWTSPSLPVITRSYPENATFTEVVPLFRFTEGFTSKAFLLLDRNITSLTNPQVMQWSEVRFIFDNSRTLENAFIEIDAVYRDIVSDDTSSSTLIIWSCAAVICIVILCGTIHVIERVCVKMEEYQTRRLELLSRIPMGLRKAVSDAFEYEAGDASEAYISERDPQSRRLSAQWKFRWRGYLGALMVCGLSCGCALFTQARVRKLRRLANIVEPFGYARTTSFVMSTMVTELMVADTPETWPNYSVIYDHYQAKLDGYRELLFRIINPGGDGNWPAITECSSDIVSLWFDPQCVSSDIKACATTLMDSAAGITENAVFAGVGTTALNYLDAALSVAATAKLGQLDPSYPPARFMMQAERYYLCEGFDRLTDVSMAEVVKEVNTDKPIVSMLYASELLFMILCYVLVFRAIAVWYKSRDRATTAMFFILPKSCVKGTPQLDNYCRTGFMDEHTSSDENVSRKGSHTEASAIQKPVTSVYPASRRSLLDNLLHPQAAPPRDRTRGEAPPHKHLMFQEDVENADLDERDQSKPKEA